MGLAELAAELEAQDRLSATRARIAAAFAHKRREEAAGHRLQYTANSDACEYLIQPSGLAWFYNEDHDDPNDALFSWELLKDGFEVGQLWSKDRIHWKAFSDEANDNIASGTVDYCARALVAKVRAQ